MARFFALSTSLGGFRQGYPLSPLLDVLHVVSEVLSAQIVTVRILRASCSPEQVVFYLKYLNMLMMLLLSLNPRNLSHILGVVRNFELGSGAKLNIRPSLRPCGLVVGVVGGIPLSVLSG